MEEFRCYEVKIEESEKASSCQELTPGHLWLAFVCITFFYITLLLKMMWCTFNTGISHTQLMMLTKISHCQYCNLKSSLHINILMSFTVDHELQSIHRNHSYLLLTWKKWINLLWPSVQSEKLLLNCYYLLLFSAFTPRIPLGVDQKILSIRKEPMLSGFLTLNAQSILSHAGNKGI